MPILWLCVILAVPTASSYSFAPGDSIIGGSGNVDGSNPYCQFLGKNCGGNPSNLPDPPSCSDGVDNNGLWGTDYDPDMWDNDGTFGPGDPGCASPYDDTESMAWDTDLTASYEGLGWSGSGPDVSQNPTVFHTGELRLGNDIGSGGSVSGDPLGLVEGESTGSGSAVERHLAASPSVLGKNRYSGAGFPSDPTDDVSNPGGSMSDSASEVHSELPDGSVVTGSGVVEPPVSAAQVPGVISVKNGERTCGNGAYNIDELSNFLTNNGVSSENPSAWSSTISTSVEPEERISGSGSLPANSFSVGCQEDYGSIVSQPFHFDQSDDLDGDGTVYRRDGLECRDDEVGSKTTTNPDGSTETKYFVETSYEQDEDHDYWGKSGDTLERFKCEDGYGPVQGGEGEGREFELVRSINCNDYNRVTGGARKQTIKPSIERPANDRAGTYTDHAAYAESGNIETVWCAYDPNGVVTVDADGPQGRGDGFVVINDTEAAPSGAAAVVGTRGPRPAPGVGSTPRDTVGQMVHSRGFGGSLSRVSTSFLKPSTQSWDTDCPSNADYCVKYIDYYTSSQLGQWGSPSNTAGAVRATSTRTMTPDRSYSVCKLVNTVHSNQVSGGDRELLDCDYEATKDGTGGDMSPLPESCGDVPDEHLVTGEGNQVDFGTLSKRLYQSQACLSFGSDTDTAGNEGEITDSACVMAGAPYAEGTVLNITEFGNGIERNRASPDFEVCLDPSESQLSAKHGDRVEWDNSDNVKGQKDFGGEWYDLDNEKVQQYVRNNFNPAAYSTNPSRVETFIRTNPNPKHPEFNPTGGETGLTLEDDCGSDRFTTNHQCEDKTSKANTGNLFYTFFDVVLNP